MAGASRLANPERGIEGPDSTEGDGKVGNIYDHV